MGKNLNIADKIDNNRLLTVKLLILVTFLLISQFSLAYSNTCSKLLLDAQYFTQDVDEPGSIVIDVFTPDIHHSISELEQHNVALWTHHKLVVANTDNLSTLYSIRAPPFIS